MFKKLLLTGFSLLFAFLLSSTGAFAAAPAENHVAMDANTPVAGDNDNDMDWGWIGLAGLLGLAGLRNRGGNPTNNR